MNNRQKIFNDPVYGFVSVPRGLLLELIDHPYFQRLRRIRQLGLAPYVYPGALHTRFHHALGALHLMQEAIETLRQKAVEITDEEAEAACIAILLHDIGHGPFSHALEHTLIEMHHESISAWFMQELNREFDGKLELALRIFNDTYSKKFLHQLVSGQLDMDRMDYLNRDSFFTGVSEGVIGYDRIIKMLAVHHGQLVVEEKGIYSIEKFLIARRLMYWQVYLHKTGVSAEHMLIHLLKRARVLALAGETLDAPKHLSWFLYHKPGEQVQNEEMLAHFARLDDNDITAAIKNWTETSDFTLAFLSKGLLDRKLFRLEWFNEPPPEAYVEQIKEKVRKHLGESAEMNYLVFTGAESNRAYDDSKEQIRILFKNGAVLPIDQCSDVPLYTQLVTKYFICYPKIPVQNQG
ncbi:MAG: HD domain-containing protein [Saprospiraceae bacterium]|nr:HD domain-containing protein [Saprospiraceae bacterium]